MNNLSRLETHILVILEGKELSGLQVQGLLESNKWFNSF